MRADIQNMVNEINKSLELLRQRMGMGNGETSA